jgi:hypothetical protein
MTARLITLTAATLLVAACGGGSDSPAKLALGTEAVVAYAAPESGTIPAVDTSLGVTVLAVRVGTQEELADGGFDVDDEDKDATPYYVDARFSNKGDGPVPRNLSVGMEDTKGNSVPTTLIINLGGGSYAPCPANDDGVLVPGESYESCTLFLVPKGTKLDRVRFVSQGPDATITFTDWGTS